ncbi:hypothetical protein BVY02_01690, partial [bacterium J17]
VVFALLLAVGALPDTAIACSCGEKQDIRTALGNSTMVFVGRVEELRENPLKPGLKEIKLAVLRKFKGFEEVQTRFVYVYTPNESALCGFNFSGGMDYLVFASGTPAHFKTNICSRTRLLDDAQRDVQLLMRLMKKKKARELRSLKGNY